LSTSSHGEDHFLKASDDGDVSLALEELPDSESDVAVASDHGDVAADSDVEVPDGDGPLGNSDDEVVVDSND
jgi:hypothetical protein